MGNTSTDNLDPEQDSSLRDWGGVWSLRSDHTSGKFRGASVTSALEVSISGNTVTVTFGGYPTTVLNLTPMTLKFKTEAGGNAVTTTLNRNGDQVRGTFSGHHIGSGEPIGGTYQGRRRH